MPHEHFGTRMRNASKPGSLGRLKGSKYRMIDAHLHVVNFVQETPGGEALIFCMDQANLDKAVIFGLPVSKVWTEYDREAPDYYLANDSRCYYYGYTDVIVAEMVRIAGGAASSIISADVRVQSGGSLRHSPCRAIICAIS